jgi:hypothetical protein
MQDNDDFKRPISPQDKEFIKFNIIKALDMASTKTIQSAIRNIIFNIAECDFPEQWGTVFDEIKQRIKQSVGNEAMLISGLMALKEVVHSNKYMIDEERATLNSLVEAFFPLLESVMTDLDIMNPPSPNKTLIQHLISKIFYSTNNVSEKFLTQYRLL